MTNTKTTTADLIGTAKFHVDMGDWSGAGRMKSSAALCLSTAEACAAEGKDDSARKWAARSLKYSVGIFHADYKAAKEAAK